MDAEAAAGPVLRDIHAAAPPSWWPPAPGWWLLAAIVLALFFFAARAAWRQLCERRARRRLLAEFDRAVEAARADPPRLATTLSTFLRRGQLRHAPQAATLTGAAWLEHLDRQTGGEDFAQGVGRALVDAPYRRQADYDSAALVALVRRALLAAFNAQVRGHV
ncbi:MAG: DUF4381 family protein [Rudaea sp.]